jgi:putative ABC transport system permease protein
MVDKDPKYQFMDVSVAIQEQMNMAVALSIFLYGFVGVITLIGCLNIINTISTNLLLRTRELAVMKAIGMTENGIRRLVCLEGIFYGIIAAFYGGIIGTLFSRYGMYNLLFKVRIFEWTIPWNHILTAITGAALIALIAGFIPLRRIYRGIIIENIRMEE